MGRGAGERGVEDIVYQDFSFFCHEIWYWIEG